MSGFIQAEPAWEWCDNDVITAVTLGEMYVSILPPCGCQWILQTQQLTFSALWLHRLLARHSLTPNGLCHHWKQLQFTSSHGLSFRLFSVTQISTDTTLENK